ncbi:MAG: hypothetical protein ACRDRK_18580 [Pseudonocardia sp.]
MALRGFHDLVHRLSDPEDTTTQLTMHDLDEAEKLADRILILPAAVSTCLVSVDRGIARNDRGAGNGTGHRPADRGARRR